MLEIANLASLTCLTAQVLGCYLEYLVNALYFPQSTCGCALLRKASL
jgi:hypothetical protein